MAFRFRCPACGELISAAETMAGMRITCAACGTGLEVPTIHHHAQAAPGAAGKASAAPEMEIEVADEAPLRPKRKMPQEEMDMTPMVDVTFLLLIFFMVTAAFSLQKTLPIPTPQESKQSAAPKSLADFEDDPQWIVVKIDSSSTFHVISGDIDKETPSRHELLVQVRQARAKSATKMLVVAHGDARHEQVVMAMDAGSVAGLEEVKLLTVEEDF